MTNNFDAILLDIEGTTTPIDFVHKTLFPFARQRIDDLVRDRFAMLSSEIDQLAGERLLDAEYSAPFVIDLPESISEYLRYLIDNDRKSTPLKSIQGKIWQAGYESGELTSEVYADVPEAFAKWRAEGKAIAIYSSGSVLAQKLLFRYTDHGDLTPYISNYFDTNTGPKREASSYAKIAEALGLDGSRVMFVSDIPAELDAAEQAGMQTMLSIRPANADAGNTHHTPISSLTEIV